MWCLVEAKAKSTHINTKITVLCPYCFKFVALCPCCSQAKPLCLSYPAMLTLL